MNNRKVALDYRITARTARILAEFLLEKGYDVHGTVPRIPPEHPANRSHLPPGPHERDPAAPGCTMATSPIRRISPAFSSRYNRTRSINLGVSHEGGELRIARDPRTSKMAPCACSSDQALASTARRASTRHPPPNSTGLV